jgi:quercetin dioxygenase-like cupin family protein
MIMFSKKRNVLWSTMCSALFVVAAFAASEAALAQVSPLSWTASPDVYKVVAESLQFRVIEGTWKPGQRDQSHSHAAGGFFYYVTGCSLRFHNPGGTNEANQPAGTAGAQPAYDSHWIENIGTETCKIVVFEPK